MAKRPAIGIPEKPTPDELAKFLARVEVSASCWHWVGSLRADGYGALYLRKKQVKAHRVAYTWWNGSIPKGLELDHLCRNHWCVNPDHLEAVSHKENILRGKAPSATHAIKTHCPAGHEYTMENTLVTKANSRICRECKKLKSRKLQGYKGTVSNKDKTHCNHGHKFTEKNTGYANTGWGKTRYCKECNRVSQRKYREKKKANDTAN